MIKDKRFIEDSFPVREVSEQGAREKNIRHGHISTLHIWWARRPLATSRATNLAALIPAPKDDKERREISKFIAEFSKWENSNNKEMIEKARKMILDANNGVPPKVLDPFAGGGSIPLEALRLGCETYANDYNPVAVLIEKCTLEYPQKYGKPIPIKQYYEERPWLDSEKKEDDLFDDEKTVNPLLEDVKYWGNWVLEEARKEIGRFYPNDPDGSIPVGYIWARTVPCQNPSCNAEIPLMRQFWLAKKKNKKVSLFPYDENGEVKFKIVGDGYEKIPEDFDPSNGTISRAIVTCPICGSMIEAKTTRKLFQEGKNGERLIAVVLTHPKERGKKYRIATEDDLKIFKEVEEYLEKKRDEFIDKWGIDPVSDEPTPEGKGRGAERAFAVKNYNLNTFIKLGTCSQYQIITSFRIIPECRFIITCLYILDVLNIGTQFFITGDKTAVVGSVPALIIDRSGQHQNNFISGSTVFLIRTGFLTATGKQEPGNRQTHNQ